MIDLNKLSAMLEQEEGLRLKPYTDTTGHLTIGVGHNLEKGISETAARYILGEDMAEACKDLDREIPWWQGLDEVRQRVLADMCFNLGWGDGIHGLSSFPNFLNHVRMSQYKDAVEHMKASHWHVQVGQRAVKLEQMMLTGQDVQKFT